MLVFDVGATGGCIWNALDFFGLLNWQIGAISEGLGSGGPYLNH